MIVLNKRKKSWEIYPIGSPKGALNTKRQAEFVGILRFREDEDGISIKRFLIKSEKEEKLLAPSKAINLLRSQAVFLAQKDDAMEDFLEKNNIKVRFTNICQHCSYEGYVTIINSDFSYEYHNQLICKSCAEETIKRELKLRGYDKKVFRNFKKVLEKTGSLDDVLKMLSPRFDPLSNADLTLFDKIKVHDDKIPKIPMKRLKIPQEFKNVIIKEKNQYLLPVQYLAIREGLLKDENLLVVSATGSGKTLVGELAGVPKAMEGKKFLFLTPLVALANQKYRDFKKRYEPLGLKVAIKVGMNRIKAKGELKLPDSNIASADIIVGTYEGIDFLLRSGKSSLLNDLGLVLIDEIHTISDEERGLRLNGLIKRIEHIFPKTQVIGLSATIKNPKDLAKDFNMKLVQYKERPVPLERHIVFVRGDVQRRLLMRKLVQKEFYTSSSKGFNGQTLIFTNSRRKTHKIANFLSGKGINTSAYHAGLSYFKKEKIEKDFSKGKIAAVVTTAALAAGVDFPASQVIFESLLMGNKWISPNEFSQMLGRAGRPSYHDRGVIYLIPEIGNEFDGESEESMALDLLESDVENIYVDYTEDGSLEQILADISSRSLTKVSDVHEFYKNLPVPIDLNMALGELGDKKAIRLSADGTIEVTKFGKAVSMSFLSIDDGVIIKDSLNDDHYLSQYFNKPFFKTNLRELRKLSDKIDEENEQTFNRNKKIQHKLNQLKNNKSKKDKSNKNSNRNSNEKNSIKKDSNKGKSDKNSNKDNSMKNSIKKYSIKKNFNKDSHKGKSDKNSFKKDSNKKDSNKSKSDKNSFKKDSNNKGSNKKGSNNKGSNNKGSNNKGSNNKGSNNKGSNNKGSNNKGSNKNDSNKKDSNKSKSDKNSFKKDSNKKNSFKKDSNKENSNKGKSNKDKSKNKKDKPKKTNDSNKNNIKSESKIKYGNKSKSSSDSNNSSINQSKDYKNSNKDHSDDFNDYSKKVIYNKRINMSKKQHKTLEEKPILVNKLNFKENIFKEINPRMSKKEVNNNNLLKVQSIALDLELFENAYLAPVVHKQIVSALKVNFSTRLFSESTLDIISSGEAIAKLDQKFQDALLKLQIDFLRCDCNDRPFCDCLQRGVSYYILNQRLNKRDPIDISKSLLKDYQIQAYPGDIFSWLDNYVRNLDAIKRVAQAYGKKEIVEEANRLIKIIETGK